MGLKSHWEKVYATKKINEVSWYQSTPRQSLEFIHQLAVPKTAAIIDVGGGDSLLADHLLAEGFSDITVLDISENAVRRARQRLGDKAEKINWITSDIAELDIDKKFDCWHDRAAFHFLTTEDEVEKYLSVAQKHITENGKMVIGAFSTEGPDRCSGLPVKQYSEQSLTGLLKKWFQKIKCITVDHITPFQAIQNFLFCSFKKINLS
jgi:ubiquinone/menaquinone biosynthesis C-methylase UbiE